MANILDPNTLAAAQSVAVATLSDSCSIYTPSASDNGLGSETIYGLRDVQPCRVSSLPTASASDALRLLNKTLYTLTMGPGASIALNERVIVTGSANISGYCVDNNTPQTDPLVVVMATIAVGN